MVRVLNVLHSCLPYIEIVGVKFQEGIASIDRIAKAIPTQIVATRDICVCHPQQIVEGLYRAVIHH
jgi:hypothetical protein